MKIRSVEPFILHVPLNRSSISDSSHTITHWGVVGVKLLMLAANAVLLISLVYVALLFAVAFVGDRRARRGNPGWLQSPFIYTLF